MSQTKTLLFGGINKNKATCLNLKQVSGYDLKEGKMGKVTFDR